MISRVAVIAASALASMPTGARANRPPLALSASPTRVTIPAGSWSAVHVTNAGRTNVVVDVSPQGFALDLRGRPRIAASEGAGRWLVVSPRRLALAAGGSGNLTVAAVVPPGTGPGEHDALVLLRTRPRAGTPVPIVMQVGVVVEVRVRGRVVRRLDVRGLRLERHGRRRTVVLTLWNRGNVSEVLPVRRVRIVLRRRGRVLGTLLPPRRRILPHSRAVMVLRYGGGVRGWVRATVVVRRPRPGTAFLRKTYRLRL